MCFRGLIQWILDSFEEVGEEEAMIVMRMRKMMRFTFLACGGGVGWLVDDEVESEDKSINNY